MTTCSADPVCQLEALIAERVGPQCYKVWFRNATRFSFAEGSLKVAVPNQFIGGWIENHFTETIQGAAQEVMGRPMEVVFGIDVELAQGLGRRPPGGPLDEVTRPAERASRPPRRQGTPAAGPVLRGCFADFVVGESNRLAYSATRAAAERPAAQFNPLFIHGACGLGKTHLLHALCNHLRENQPDLTWVCVTGEDFTNQFVYAVKTGERDAFRHRYRPMDVLVIDDIHFLANKRATQEEFLHTFNAVAGQGKQVVMASDAHPKLIGHLSESLVNRFVAGMVVKIDPPETELRVGILQQRVAKMKRPIPDGILRYVAEQFSSNVRELEGALLKLVALADLAGEALTMALAEKALSDLVQHALPLLRLSHLENMVSIYFGLTPADLHTSRKTRTIALARGIVMHLARKYTSMSYPEIGRHLGNKNHSTVILANRRIAQLIQADGLAYWSTPAGEREAPIRQIMRELEGQLSQANGST